ncbi:MFS general substrate transporter [Hypoxylon trugodes]|uniref:MFS general substrate transporter n=1 Tax=Hypoxylon trugodes TaxID=326681 RepID=UPI00219A3035|nr:MFS general substrate transporter [Hypoxylon trugodes]KAI1385548.1 MFS general substrate transporter [Hypoxylon trugodes]
MGARTGETAEIENAPTQQSRDGGGDDDGGGRDIAGSFLSKNAAGQRIVVTPAESARVLRRIDAVILPIMLTVYFLQGLDKATLAYSSVFGLLTDTKLVGDQYSWLGSIVYLAQLVMQPPLAWLLVRLPIAKFTSIMVLFWGISLACMAAAHNFGGLITTRFFLGVFEASVAPSFVAITQMWWRRREQTVRTSYWYAMNGITNMFGSLITYGLGHISSRLRSYQIIFMFFGVITVAFSFVMLAFMPDSPIEAKFLNDHDKIIAVERLRMNQMGVISREWRNDHFKETMLDPKSWFWFALLFSISIPSGGISTFGPLIVSTFGFDQFQTILFNIPFGFVQLVATVGGAFLAQKIKMKGPVIAGLCLPPIAGCVMLMVLPRDVSSRAPLLVGYYLISVYPGITPLIYSWASQNTAGDTKRKCTNAVLFIGQSVGNVIGPLLYTQTEAPGYSRGLRSNLALYVAIIVLSGLTTAYLRLLNAGHAKRRVAMGKSAIIVDTSLDSAKEVAAREEINAATAEATGGEEVERPGERAFENLTDLQNEEFVFVY